MSKAEIIAAILATISLLLFFIFLYLKITQQTIVANWEWFFVLCPLTPFGLIMFALVSDEQK